MNQQKPKSEVLPPCCVAKEKALRAWTAEAYRMEVATLTPVSTLVLRAILNLSGGEKMRTAFGLVGVPVELGTQIYEKLKARRLLVRCEHGVDFPDVALKVVPHRIGCKVAAHSDHRAVKVK